MKIIPLAVHFLLFYFQLCSSAHATDNGSFNDRQALLAFKNSITFDPNQVLSSWDANTNVCNWTGISCNKLMRVTEIDLESMGLVGYISPFLGNLSFLESLNVYDNSFHGVIPELCQKLSNLQELRLQGNQLTGSIPTSLGNCSNLKELHLWRNQLSGPIPTSLANCSNMQVLNLWENQLSGPIPSLANCSNLQQLGLDQNQLSGPIPSLANCSNLQVLNLVQNQLSGSIPTSLANCSNLQQLCLDQNQLSGPIPKSLGNCSSLEQLSLSENQFRGLIPTSLGNCSNLQILSLWGNQLSGPIPTSLGNCSKLKILYLTLNNLTGTVPLQLGKLSSLQHLRLDDNFLTSSRTLPFLAALINCSSLQTLYLGYNYLAEDLSPSIGKLSTNLSILSLGYNLIGGSIPQEIGNLTNLTYIDFTNNALTGPIPSTLERLKMLERLYLDQNNLQGPIPNEIGALKHLGLLSLSFNLLTGRIPQSIGSLPQLRRLHLHHNQFDGRIPVELFQILTLELLDLSHNNFTGNIPPEVAGLQNLQFYFNLSWNSLHGSLPAEIGKMAMVQGIDLSGNQLSGVIPASIVSCTNLQYLNLSHNMFEGPITDSLSMLKNLEALDLSYNKLSGTIPDSLQNIKVLSFLDVSFNLLIGEVPKAGLFTNLTASSFRGNPGLCGQWIPLLPACPSASAGSTGGPWNFHKLFKYISSVISFLVVYCFYISLLYKYFFGKGNVEQPSIEFPHPRISYKELTTATNGFGKGNLLGVGGVGSVYKGVLDNGTLIAVKALNMEDEEAHKSFDIECQVLGKTRHRNIVKVITSCSNLDFKGLVFEFMSNGSLERHLHCDAGKCNIGGVCKMYLQTRVQIAMDIARGLAYLHHDCSIQVVHCDLKPNNVLLDFYMTAHIADFGNAHILSENSMHSFSSSTTLKGALGYIAPEYGVGARISAKGDVYSYGILLLEMLTRERPTHQMFVDGLSLRMWVSMAFPDRISEVVDDSLLLCKGGATDSTCSCLIQLVRVALLCSKDSPKDRPSMAEVVEMLECIEDMFEGSRINSKYQSDLYQMVISARWAGNLVKVENGQSTSTFQSSS
ncbi:putative leucine-rich repeat receptor-like serine/threonine-protein kinase At2g24130 [Cryptomeria japonica]|uniref:putative leucine-rich repeat receptor-like serine/threonine-protein kinase At2g24130 n=1 Tax=Cryptomeria japonica TaxID=3369 RepID=UPI0027DA0377|nr:putative leucine-rich repeat receptor-like serine/threonine-protein kinase At2g24130 [Cryptomeria japonica]